MVKRAFLCSLFVLISCFIFSQEKQEWDKTAYAKQVITDLAAASMHGRGYVSEGDHLAAAYMKKAFQQAGLKSFTTDYYQSFTFPVNTFPGELAFSIMGKENGSRKKILFHGYPGLNMLIGAGCKSTDNDYTIIVFDSTDAVSDKSFEKFERKIKPLTCFILIDERNVSDKKKLDYFKKVKSNCFAAAGIIEFTKKLTHTVSQEESQFLSIKILQDSISTDLKKVKQLSMHLKIENKFMTEHVAENVIGYVSGSQHPDSFLVFSAHYDHLGQLGENVYFPGANDNASGCAMLLNLVRYYSLAENKPAYSIVFIAFAGEEAGLLGSSYYTKHPLFPLRSIRFLLNMDIMGTGDDGITVVNGTIFKNEFDELVTINKENTLLKEVKIRGKAANSDHYPFSENGVKAFFIYTIGGIKAYHDVYDRAETLPLTKFEELFKLITHFAAYLQHY